MYNPLEYLTDRYQIKDAHIGNTITNLNLTYKIIKKHPQIIEYDLFKHMFEIPRFTYYSNSNRCINKLWEYNIRLKHNLEIVKEIYNTELKIKDVEFATPPPSDIIQPRIYRYSSFVKENFDKYNIKLFSRLDFSNMELDDIFYIFEKKPHFKWNWFSMSINPKVTIDVIKNNPYIPWDWKGLSYNPNITMKIIEDNIELPWDWQYITFNPNFSIDMIKKYPNMNWNWYSYSEKFIKPEIILYLLDTMPNIKLNFVFISLYINIDIVLKFPNKGWRWKSISVSQYIKLEDIENNMNLPWVWKCISRNPNLTMKFIKDHPNENWDWWGISRNYNITMDDIENNPNENWKWRCVGFNPNLTVKMIEKNLDKPWCWDFIYDNDFIVDIRINARNKIYYCWKKRNIRCKIKHRRKLKYVNAEIRK